MAPNHAQQSQPTAAVTVKRYALACSCARRYVSVVSEEVKKALKEILVPVLRVAGFKGSFPNFRRRKENQIDLITVQFDKWGGGFVLEISKCAPEGITTSWGKHVPPNKVTAHDLNPDQRFRLQPKQLPGTDGWFRFENAIAAQVAQQATTYIKKAEEWWSDANT